MIGLELYVALLLQRPRDPQEVFDLLVQVAIILVIILIPAAKAIFDSIQKRQGGGTQPPSRRPPPQAEASLEQDASGRREARDAFEELLRGGATVGEAERAAARDPAEVPFETWSPDEDDRRHGPAQTAAASDSRQEQAARAAARRQELADRQAREARERAQRADRAARRERQRETGEREERERRLQERADASSAGVPAGSQRSDGARAVAGRRRRSRFPHRRTRVAWQDAIVLSEVLGPPLALRDPRRGPGSATPRGD